VHTEPCPFCAQNRPKIAANAHAFAISDGYPVSPGHSLIVPNRHVQTVLDLADAEYAACFDLTRAVCRLLQEQQRATDFNIGANCGRLAGQTVLHAHIHVIPRYPGDVSDPRGGIRNVIPGSGPYAP
jgi:diadenosine tetraphosphate (Ap4A) HIT family hydrolase